MAESKLSIIIPCYNCQDTLEEAFRSVYEQNLAIPFEVIMVDDGSTDQTRPLIKRLAEGHQEVKFFFHEKNRGGGSTRNTGVNQAEGEILFFLDSDDILGKNFLQKMYQFMLQKNCDGVGISTSIKFKGKNIKDISFINHFGYVGEKIPFTSLLQKPGEPLCSLYSTFMITKQAFNLIGGYPSDHGFDTQGLAWRFLANGLVAYTCPETTYYHRVNFNKSYYSREYEAGKTNHNWFQIYEEFLYLFDPLLQRDILQYDLNRLDQSLPDFINKHNLIWHSNFIERIRKNGRHLYEQEIKNGLKVDSTDYYWLGTKKMSEGLKIEALDWFKKARELNLISPHLDQKMILTNYHFESAEAQKQAEASVKKMLTYKKRGSALFWPIRLYRKINKLINQRFGKYWKIIKIRWQSSPRKILFFHWIVLRFKKMWKIDFTSNSCLKSSQIKIDVVIPTVTKDYQLLELATTSLKNLCPSINKIFIVAPASEFIEKFCQENKKCLFVDERSVLGYGKDRLNYQVDGLDRSGWLFQQLLKLSGDKFVETENYLVLDSDTILLNKHSFIENEKFILFENEEWNQPYFEAFERLFGYSTKNRLSFTSHMMIFNTAKLKEMKQELEQKHQRTWDQVYVSVIDPNEQSSISDYDTYANWLWLHYPKQVIRKPLYNRSVDIENLTDLDKLKTQYGQKYNSISFHFYYLKERAKIIKTTNEN